MNKAIRATVVARAAGRCEACHISLGPDSERGHFDHFFSRRNGESVETGWMLCPECDDAKTNNRPSAKIWLQRFIKHANTWGDAEANDARDGYYRAVEMAEIRIANLEQKGLAR